MGVEILNFGLKFSKIGMTPTPKFYIFGKLWRGLQGLTFLWAKVQKQKKLRFLTNYASSADPVN